MATKLLNLKNPIIVFLLLIAFPFISHSQIQTINTSKTSYIHLQVNVAASSIEVLGNSIQITDGDINPDLADHTDFGVALSRTFTIVNTSPSAGGSNLIGSISISNTTDFSISPTSFSIKKNGFAQNFVITKITNTCDATCIVTIIHDGNNDFTAPTDEFIFSIISGKAEINLLNGATGIAVGGADNPTEFLNIDAGSISSAVTYTIENTGSCDLYFVC